MDDFGVLVQNFGIKPQGKSAPMSSSTKKPSSRNPNYTSGKLDPSFGAKPFSNSTDLGSGSFLDDQNDDIFGLNSSNKSNYNKFATSDVFDDVFQLPRNNASGGGGLGFDVEAMFKGSMNLGSSSSSNSNEVVGDDLIWGFSGKKSSGVVVETDDLLSSDPVDDFLGKLGKFGSDRGGAKGGNESKGKKVVIDELIPGFGRSNNGTNDRAQAASAEKSSGFSSLEELEDFATGRTKKTSKGNVNGFSAKKTISKESEGNFIDIEGSLNGDTVHIKKAGKVREPMFSEGEPNLDSFVSAHFKKSLPVTEDKSKGSGFSSIEELEDFATGRTEFFAKGHVNGNTVKKEVNKTVSKKSAEPNFIDIEGTFSGDSVHANNAEKATDLMFPEEAHDLDSFFSAHTKKKVPVTEDTFMNTQTNEVPADLFSGTTFKKEKKVSPAIFLDDFSSIFGGTPTSGVFEEIEGESDERRRLRLERHRKATARMEQALANLNQREYQAQQEQDERHRIAEAMETEMKRWAAGKEGNLRALLSSLEQVLAPELGWRPVTLTDLITSSQVKVAYKKAALCVHPDKVQQKGASLEQKYVAEKAFDLLKEAWNKFNTEELR